uniref:Uncharacterized protein n=1 Tax=Branchiostoma floridae TaxID=7739 RepID=C3YJR7_BRAFL|eukprot:XP_002603363.1 hypothetical protein BRAFLDRAFT_80356 [Branchiostoma floridae]
MVRVHTSPPHPSGSQQNCLRPDMPYKTGHADWSGLDLGLFIGAGVLVTAGLYETPAGVLCRSAAFLFGKNDRKVALSEASRGDKKDQRIFAQFVRSAERNEETTSTEEANQCPRDVSNETTTAVGSCRSCEDARQGSTHCGRRPYSFHRKQEDVWRRRGQQGSVGRCCEQERGAINIWYRACSSGCFLCSLTCKPDLVKELMTSNSDISDQKSTSACPLGGGQVSEGNAEKGHGFCGDDVTSDFMNTCDLRDPADGKNAGNDVMNTCSLPDPAGGENAGNDVISRSGETSPRRADFTEAEVITVTACPVRHELSAATREVIGSTPHVTDKTDTEISSEQFLSEGNLKLRCAVLYADWREDSQFCHRDDVTTNQKIRFSWFGQEDDDDLDDVTKVKVYCAVLEGVWREECGLVENHVTNTTGGDDDMESYYPGHGRRNGIQSGNKNWV